MDFIKYQISKLIYPIVLWYAERKHHTNIIGILSPTEAQLDSSIQLLIEMTHKSLEGTDEYMVVRYRGSHWAVVVSTTMSLEHVCEDH